MNEAKNSDKLKIFLCDLTHITPQGNISSNVFPLGIGLIAAFALNDDNIRGHVDIDLFKFPDELILALEDSGAPDIIGFSHYSWNSNLSLHFARIVKHMSPETLVVFGGPNYDLEGPENQKFWEKNNSFVDLAVVLEGEQAFTNLILRHLKNDKSIVKTKRDVELIGNVHKYDKCKQLVVRSKILPRVDVDRLPSPYLNGLMDKFFERKLIPLVYGTRGCPFKCTFCQEGDSYFNKVKQRLDRFEEEINEISNKARPFKINDLFMADANFGMFKEDRIRSEILARIRQATSYPRHIYVSTGKNQKERVVDAVTKLDGAIQLSASLQSTDPSVLVNIERSNISLEALKAAANEVSSSEIDSYSELILGLPGETLKTHLDSIKDVIGAGYKNIRIYQLILLPQTKMSSSTNRIQYGMQTKFRYMPRCFTEIRLYDTCKHIAEIEEIVVSTSSLNYGEYKTARKIGLLTECVHNGGLFDDLRNFLSHVDVEWVDFFESLALDIIDDSQPAVIKGIFDEFINLMEKNFWEEERVPDKRIEPVNELARAKSRMIIQNFAPLNKYVFDSAVNFIGRKQKTLEKQVRTLRAIERVSQEIKAELFEPIPKSNSTIELNTDGIDIRLFEKALNLKDLSKNGNQVIQLRFANSAEQLSAVSDIRQMYGNTADADDRIIMRHPFVKNFSKKILANEPVT